VTGADHYDTLGVSRDATATQIREAYRRRAREEHPDRTAVGSAVHLDSMADVNEAYRVLGDPGRRAVYDASLRGTGSAVPPSDRSRSSNGGQHAAAYQAGGFEDAITAVHPSHVGPARVPWRMLLFCGLLAIVGVVVLAQFNQPGDPAPPDGILRIGDCVAIEANGDAREVHCIGNTADPSPDDLVVVAFIPFDATCPGLTEPHRDRQGMGVACIPIPD